MSLSIISSLDIEKEQDTVNRIYRCIEERKSIIFDSGAGAGKTYALVQGIKYAINIYSKELEAHNQKIICITYTNVATNEVKERLGNTSVVLVSTIHDRVWEFIKDYKKQLVQIHKEQLLDKIGQIQKSIKEDDKYRKHREMSDEQKALFLNLMKKNKDLYYRSYSYKAAQFKEAFNDILEEYSILLSNVSNFKEIVNAIFKLDNYKECIQNIDNKVKGYTSIVYDSRYNTDRLYRMRISHDTLLEYGLSIIKKYDLLKQMIIDKYPLIFVDEYQDTSEMVVKIMNCLDQYANKIGHKLFVGYFGDVVQNIYSDGIGKGITGIHKNLELITKEFNRRSTQEVINVANRIRNDRIIQKSIYEDCTGGSIKFYVGRAGDIESFISKYINKWQVKIENPLHCFVLTNKTVAQYIGFQDIYNVFSKVEIYKGSNYNQLNTELLSDDPTKLGEIPNLIFRIISLKQHIEDNQTQVINFLPRNLCIDMNLKQLRDLVAILRQMSGESLGEYINKISDLYYKDRQGKYREIIDSIFEIKQISLDIFKDYLINKLFPSTNSSEEAHKAIQALLDIDINQYKLWYNYIMNNNQDKVIYHTYHGTKGLEFNNVIIIMENAFGRDKDYFKFFFSNYMCVNNLNEKELAKFEQIRNLLYVSATRAITNLRILYVDEISEFKNGIESIFSKVYTYSDEQ